jgi:hypothetical protein
MKTVVGIFVSLADAKEAVNSLKLIKVSHNQINLLAPRASEEEIASIPTMDTEGPGVGKAFGGLVGGALGAAGGVHLGTAGASLVIPGVGPVIAIGVVAAALLGTCGTLAGAAVGESLENLMDEGLPKDELFIYEDALRKGRTVLIFLARDEMQADEARQIMAQAGAESLDSAREKWWLGLRGVEEQHYTGEDFKTDETYYRRGFEAAQEAGLHGKSYSAALKLLQKRHSPGICNHLAFRRGYERGQAYYENLRGMVETKQGRKEHK